MRKLTQNILPGETLTFPSCKTFVYLRSEHAVSFKFITMFNKIDRTIDNFQDSFSVTANTYFLRVEITSDNAQELSCILIEDTGIDYTPITGDVFISNNENNFIPAKSYNINSRDYPVPVYSPKGVLTNKKIDNERLYKGNYNERFKAGCYVESQQAASDLECYGIFPKMNTSDNNPLYIDAFLTSLIVYPETDNFLELWIYTNNSNCNHDFITPIETLINPDGKVKVFTNYHSDTYSKIYYKNVARSILENETEEYLLHSFPIKSGVPFELPMAKPIWLQPSSYVSSVYQDEFLTITTKTNCHFNFNVTIEMFENGFFDNQVYTPKNF